MTRQSPNVNAARILLSHATAVASDHTLPERIRQAAEVVVEQACDEIREELRQP